MPTRAMQKRELAKYCEGKALPRALKCAAGSTTRVVATRLEFPHNRREQGRMANSGSFKKGQSGNPGGRPAVLLTPLLREIMQATESGNISKAKLLAQTLVDKAIAGDMDAIKVVLDRIDGKVALPIEGNDMPLAMTIKWATGT